MTVHYSGAIQIADWYSDHHLNNRQFDDWTVFNHSNTGLVRYSDHQCSPKITKDQITKDQDNIIFMNRNITNWQIVILVGFFFVWVFFTLYTIFRLPIFTLRVSLWPMHLKHSFCQIFLKNFCNFRNPSFCMEDF